MSKKIYGYCRISTREQSIERQIRNIKGLYEDVTKVEEVLTGTKVEGRKEFEKLVGKWAIVSEEEVLKGGKVKKGDE